MCVGSLDLRRDGAGLSQLQRPDPCGRARGPGALRVER